METAAHLAEELFPVEASDLPTLHAAAETHRGFVMLAATKTSSSLLRDEGHPVPLGGASLIMVMSPLCQSGDT